MGKKKYKTPRTGKYNVPVTMTTKSNTTKKKANNLFAIMLSDQKTIDEIQLKSGQLKQYSTEWQFHYWSAAAEIAIDDEKLFIIVPLVFFNYEQSVSGGSVDWDIREVTRVSESLRDLAYAEFDIMMKKFGEELNTIFNPVWHIVQLNNTHVHPQSINRFSGTDCNSTKNNPGIVHPYEKTDTYIPYVSSLLQHIGPRYQAKYVHSKFKVFFGDVDTSATYAEGKMIHFIKNNYMIGEEPTGEIAQWFGIKPKYSEHYVLKDNLDKDQGDELLKTIKELFIKSNYEPNTDNIDAANIKTKIYNSGYGIHNSGLYGDDTLFYGNSGINNYQEDYEDMTEQQFKAQPIYQQRKIIRMLYNMSYVDANKIKDKDLFDAFADYLSAKYEELDPKELSELEFNKLPLNEQRKIIKTILNLTENQTSQMNAGKLQILFYNYTVERAKKATTTKLLSPKTTILSTEKTQITIEEMKRYLSINGFIDFSVLVDMTDAEIRESYELLK